MRSIGQLDNETLAARFGDYLFVQGIENQVEDEEDGGFSVWVIEDEKVPQAAAMLERFRAAPDAPEFVNAGSAADRQREAEEKAERNRRSTYADAERLTFEKREHVQYPWLPILLIIACAAVSFYSSAGENRRALMPLLISLSPIKG